ncbi:MAG: PEP-CTERM system histidine kinase PrsK [Hahellaceae bacterium]|nr:PEP-CTERM system histidine kinase PrsK [Hahellaceae bacterium]
MNLNFGAISHGTGALVYLIIATFIMRSYFRRNTDKALIAASLTTSLWMTLQSIQSATGFPSFYFRYTAETARNISWLVLLFLLLGFGSGRHILVNRSHFRLAMGAMILLSAMIVTPIVEKLTHIDLISGHHLVLGQILVALLCLILLEQVWRNSFAYGRSSIKYLAIALAGIYGYDFFMYADALLLNEISPVLWDTRGIVNTLVAPLIAITLINSKKQPIEMQVSRQVVFNSSIISLAGIYLVVMSAGGYYVKYVGGTWGNALQVLFVFLAFIVLLFLFSSSKLRARLMVYISQNFFDYKYDYRDEWVKSTKLLTQNDANEDLSVRVIRVLAELVESRAGVLWFRNDEGNFVAKGYLNIAPIKHNQIDGNADIIEYFNESDWVIDLKEYIRDPTSYNLLEIPEVISNAEHPWLIIPLYQGASCVGLVMLCQPIAPIELNWENFDLIKVVSRQACSYLVQNDSQDRLAEAKQFDAVNKTSAFLVHDLKTVVAQLSLMVKNAERHKSKPQFIDDMINTTGHSVEKMTHLLAQLRNETTDEATETLNLWDVLRSVVAQHAKIMPAPELHEEKSNKPLLVKANANQLKSVIGHIVQNAQDATPKTGEISVTVKEAKDNAVIFIQDNGAGMSEAFIKDRLFKPFESTKGLTGMGIGAYQSREYIRKIGGTLSVTSEVGLGSCFSIKIPLIDRAS